MKKMMSPPVMQRAPSGSRKIISRSTLTTVQRWPREQHAAVLLRADQTVPRSSARPTAPGAMSSSGTRDLPDERIDVPAGPSAAASRSIGLLKSSSDATESTENSRNCSQSGPARPNRCSAPMAIAAMPKKMT